MRSWLYTAVAAACIIGATTFARAESITVATVNNNDMIVMQKLSSQWEQQTGQSRSIGWCWRRTCCASALPPTSRPVAASST